MSWTLPDYQEWSKRIAKALDSVPMATDEPAEVNILNMRDRITELEDHISALENQLEALRGVAQAAQQFVAHAVIVPEHSLAVRRDYHELVACLATLAAQECCGSTQPQHASNCLDAAGN